MARSSEALGEDLEKLISEGPAEKLGLTVNTQPVMLACSVAFYEAAREAGIPEPAVMAGHSLGEYSALTAAGAFRLEDAVPLVRFRAQAMQEAVRWVLAAWPRSSVSRMTRLKPCAVRRQRPVSLNP